jgi:hypothetical protein
MSVFGHFNEASLVIAEGLPGSGKSYESNSAQVEWLLSGNPVVTNLRIRSIPKFRVTPPGEYLFLEDADFDLDKEGRTRLISKLFDIKQRFPSSHPLLVIDECHDIFNARNWKDNDKGGFFSWIAQHRHMGISVLLITQHHGMLDKALRVRAQEFWWFENLVKDSKLGAWLWIIGRNVHRRVCFANKGGAPGKLGYSVKLFKIRKKKAQRYSSGQIHKIGLADTFRGRSDMPRKVVVSCMIGMLVVLIAFGSRALANRIKVPAYLPSVPVLPYKKPAASWPVPPVEGKLDGFYSSPTGAIVVIFDDGSEFQTTSTDAAEYEEKIGQKVAVIRPAVRKRLWMDDFKPSNKKSPRSH